MADMNQCSKCEYWNSSTGHEGSGIHFCHYYLRTEKRRQEENGVCLSYQERPKAKKRLSNIRGKNPWLN
jgi:hypothetical protein